MFLLWQCFIDGVMTGDIFNTGNNKKERGLKYLAVTAPTDMVFSTGSNNNWSFSGKSDYNYNLDSTFKCSSDYSGNPNFTNAKGTQLYDHNYASGRLTYNKVPSTTLTDLGSFNADYRDQEPSDKEVPNETFGSLPSAGNNYVINVKTYLDTIKRAQSYCTEENAFKNSDATLVLANLIIDYSKTDFSISHIGNDELNQENSTLLIAQKFANELDSRVTALNNAIKAID